MRTYQGYHIYNKEVKVLVDAETRGKAKQLSATKLEVPFTEVRVSLYNSE